MVALVGRGYFEMAWKMDRRYRPLLPSICPSPLSIPSAGEHEQRRNLRSWVRPLRYGELSRQPPYAVLLTLRLPSEVSLSPLMACIVSRRSFGLVLFRFETAHQVSGLRREIPPVSPSRSGAASGLCLSFSRCYNARCPTGLVYPPLSDFGIILGPRAMSSWPPCSSVRNRSQR